MLDIQEVSKREESLFKKHSFRHVHAGLYLKDINSLKGFYQLRIFFDIVYSYYHLHIMYFNGKGKSKEELKNIGINCQDYLASFLKVRKVKCFKLGLPATDLKGFKSPSLGLDEVGTVLIYFEVGTLEKVLLNTIVPFEQIIGSAINSFEASEIRRGNTLKNKTKPKVLKLVR